MASASKGDSKFGTFGGVYTPSLLTILGVIMYLRLPMIVGSSEMVTSLGLILAAHVVSVCTGLSIASIATDRNVGAGGPYYIVSRSLGLPIGGTLGLALFLGLCFSISLYVIGFSESFLSTIGADPTNPTALRICGTATVVLLTIITFISTSLAIKTQYLILAAIGISLFAIFTGSPDRLPVLEITDAQRAAPLPDTFVLFGIFFPAVTGFTAGVNMSGDLRNAKRAIPRETMAAIFTGMAVYLSLAIFLKSRVPDEQLRFNPRVLEDLAYFGPAVTAGIWGATLSSALGSILGAPRILQTVSTDGITPRWFARGYGKTNEPRNALLLAFAIGEAGILIADLDAIARVVSIVFMTTYSFLNLAAAIESWVSPDFRPEFRIPKMVSVTGGLTSVLLMIQMDIGAMAIATVVLALLYVYLQRRQLRLESGDAWEGIWSALVRTGLHRLAGADRQQRNWRPNILMFRPDDGEARHGLRRTAGALISGNGMLTDIRLGAKDAAQSDDDEPALLDAGPIVGVFSRRIATEDPYATIEAVAAHHGHSGIEPNTVLLDWDAYAGDSTRLASLIDGLREQDLNTLLFSDTSHEAEGPPRIDVWWRAQSSPALGIALARFVTGSPALRRASVRFLTVSRDSSMNDGLRAATRRQLEEARLTGDVEVILDTVEPRPFEEHVGERSRDAVLAILELPPSPIREHIAALTTVAKMVPSVLYIGPSSTFGPARRTVRATREEQVDALDPVVELPELVLPAVPALAHHAERFAARVETAVDAYFQQSLARLGARNLTLLEGTEKLVTRHFGMLDKGLDAPNPVKQRRTANRVQSAFLMECGKLIDEFVTQDLADQRDILEGRTRALLEDGSLADPDEVVVIERDAEEFEPDEDDSRELAKLKAKRLATAKEGRVRYEQPTAPLTSYYVQKELVELADDVTRAFVAEAWKLAVQLLKVWNASRTSMTLIQGLPNAGNEGALSAFIERERESATIRLGELKVGHVARIAELRASAAADARDLAQDYADDVARIDLPIFVETKRKLPRDHAAFRASFLGAASTFYGHQRALFERAQVGLTVSAFQHRLATIVQRTSESIALEVKNGISSGYAELTAALRAFLDDRGSEPLDLRGDLTHRIDPSTIVEAFVRDAQRSADELPETIRTLSDQSIQKLSDGRADDVEVVDLPLRRLAQFLVDAELVGPLTALLAEVPAVETRAVGVAQDVIRLVSFHQDEFDEAEATDGFHAHMRPVVESSLARLIAELEPLGEIVPSVEETLQVKLAAVLRGTDVYELTSSALALGQYIRRHQGQRAVSGAQSLALRAAERVRRALVSAVYGRSAGVLMARRLRDAGDDASGTLVDRVSRLVERQSPTASVLEDLPFYYRQLFFGKNTFNETFWVERDSEISAARRGIAQHERGARGVLIVTGEPDSGKTAVCRRLTSRALSKRPLYWIAPPESARASVNAFRAKLAEVTGERGQPADIVAALPDRSVIVIEDLELWWERGAEGLVVIDLLLSLIRSHAGRVLFVIDVGEHAFGVIDRFRPLADHAVSVVSCGPLSAEAIKEIVMLRHGSTGVSFELDGTKEDDLTEWRIARLFSQHFSVSRGLVGMALASWITNVEKASGRDIEIRTPERLDWEILDRLRPEWVAILVQLLLHKRLTRECLMRVSQLDGSELEQQLDVLTRMGLVNENRQGVLRLNRFVTHALIERLRERRIIS